jgi:amidohydrolase
MSGRASAHGLTWVALAVALLAGSLAPEAAAVPDDLAARLTATAAELEPALVAARRWFHQHPELSNREHETAAEIARRLHAMGYAPRTGVAHTGVVAVLEGGRPGPVVAWRADIDALPIAEQAEIPFRSLNDGVMHACGHDLHLTIALGVAETLMRHRDEVAGTIVFLFQPAEEGPPPGEEGGAPLMIAEGALADPRPAAIFGLHVMPTLPTGEVGWRAGGIMAAADRFRLTISGRMSHGSAPQDGVDAIYVAAEAVTALQSVVSRETDPRRPLVISVGTFAGGRRFNVIAGEAVLTGTVRTVDETTWAAAPEALERVVAGVCAAHRATYELDYERINPVTANDPRLAGFAAASLRRVLGADNVVEVEPIMAAEDFAHYLREIPGVYLFLGVGHDDPASSDYLHTPTFRPDEAAIGVGVRAAAILLTDYTSAMGGAAGGD